MSQIISLKNQKEFDAVNRIGKKLVGKFMIVIRAMTSSIRHESVIPAKAGTQFLNFLNTGSRVVARDDDDRALDDDDTSRNDASIVHSSTILGLKVGRKFGNAVKRNKFKRRVRAMVRDFAKSSTESNAFIIIPKSYAVGAT